jgi:taurine dioxygenase
MADLIIEQTNPCVGAAVSGIDLRAPLDAATIAGIEVALGVHGVLFFREQPINPEQQLAFARQLGEISIPPFRPKYGNDPELVVLDQISPKGEGADEWHSDNTFMSEPPMGSILKAIVLPTSGGDTCFANMHAAYEALSLPIQRPSMTLPPCMTSQSQCSAPSMRDIATRTSPRSKPNGHRSRTRSRGRIR